MIIETYGKVKRVSPAGRDQMIAEFNAVHTILSQVHPDAQMPMALITKSNLYLQAYKYSLEELWQFINDHKVHNC